MTVRWGMTSLPVVWCSWIRTKRGHCWKPMFALRMRFTFFWISSINVFENSSTIDSSLLGCFLCQEVTVFKAIQSKCWTGSLKHIFPFSISAMFFLPVRWQALGRKTKRDLRSNIEHYPTFDLISGTLSLSKSVWKASKCHAAVISYCCNVLEKKHMFVVKHVAWIYPCIRCLVSKHDICGVETRPPQAHDTDKQPILYKAYDEYKKFLKNSRRCEYWSKHECVLFSNPYRLSLNGRVHSPLQLLNF